jgi:hypothetical protein
MLDPKVAHGKDAANLAALRQNVDNIAHATSGKNAEELPIFVDGGGSAPAAELTKDTVDKLTEARKYLWRVVHP